MKERSINLDIAKGFAMYLVVLGHLLNQLAGDPAVIINFCHMPTMFLISGYLLSSSLRRSTPGQVLKKKLRGLLLPYLAWSAVSFAANVARMAVSGVVSCEGVTREAVDIFLYARSVWFLVQLFLAFLVFLAVFQISRRLPIGIGVLGVAVWLCLALLLPDRLLATYKFKWLFPFFLAGYLLAEKPKLFSQVKERGLDRILMGASLLFPLLAAAVFRDDLFWQYTDFRYDSAVAVLYGILCCIISGLGIMLIFTIARGLSRCRLKKGCVEIGRYSMDIYVVHMLLIKFIPFPEGWRRLGLLFSYGILPLYALAIVLFVWKMSAWMLRRFRIYRCLVGA